MLTRLEKDLHCLIYSFVAHDPEYEKRTGAKRPTLWPLISKHFLQMHQAWGPKQLVCCVPLDFVARVNVLQWEEYFAAHEINKERCSKGQRFIRLVPFGKLPEPPFLRLDSESIYNSHVHTENAGGLWALRQCLDAMQQLELLPFVDVIRLEIFVPPSKQVSLGGAQPFFSSSDEENLSSAFRLLCNLREFHLRIMQARNNDPLLSHFFKVGLLLPLSRSIMKAPLILPLRERLEKDEQSFVTDGPFEWNYGWLAPFRGTMVGSFVVYLLTTGVVVHWYRPLDEADCTLSIIRKDGCDKPSVTLWQAAE